jgi:hypothetical protein
MTGHGLQELSTMAVAIEALRSIGVHELGLAKPRPLLPGGIANDVLCRAKLHTSPDCAAPSLGYIVIMGRKPNPRWVIDCRTRLASITHSEIGKDRRLIDYLIPAAPEIPSNGQEMVCPSCKTRATYTRRDLHYQA